MTRETDLFHRLLGKYKLVEPLAPDVRRYMIQSQPGILKASLRAAGHYSVTYGLVLRIYFSARQRGMRLSLKSSRLILFAVSAIIIAVITAVTMVLAANIPLKKETAITLAKAIETPEERKDPVVKETVQSSKEYLLGVQLLISENEDRDMTRYITKKIAERLIDLKGKDRIIDMSEGKRKNVKKMLVGSVSRMGKRYIITARVVDVTGTKIIFGTSASAAAEEEIDQACRRVANDIARSIEQ